MFSLVSECLAPVDRIIVSSHDPQCITSPNYSLSAEKGASYPLFLTCTWHLSAASGCRIDLRFQGRVQMKTRKGSCQQWVEVKLRRNKDQAGPRSGFLGGLTIYSHLCFFSSFATRWFYTMTLFPAHVAAHNLQGYRLQQV